MYAVLSGFINALIVLTGGHLRGAGRMKISVAGIVTAKIQQKHWKHWIGTGKKEEVVGNTIRLVVGMQKVRTTLQRVLKLANEK